MCDVFVIFENHSQKKLSVFDRIKFSREIALIHFELIFIINGHYQPNLSDIPESISVTTDLSHFKSNKELYLDQKNFLGTILSNKAFEKLEKENLMKKLINK